MANKEIAELTAATTPDGGELLHGVQDGNSRKFTVDQIRGFPAGQTAALAQGDILYVNGSDELVRLPKGASGQLLSQNAGLTAPEWVTTPFTKEYVSAEQTITSGGLLSLTHGLGSTPKSLSFALICKTAENGYAVGDTIDLGTIGTATSIDDARSLIAKKTPTTVDIRFGNNANTFSLLNWTTGAGAAFTNANWRLVVRAWA